MKERDGGFSATLFKNNLTGGYLTEPGLNERQVKVVAVAKEKGRITTKNIKNHLTYQEEQPPEI